MRKCFLSTIFAATAALATMSAQQSPPPNQTPVPERQENQQDRIAEGIKTGKLTPREAAHMEHHQAMINRQVARDRRANGGKLTAGERAKVNREMDRTSGRIFHDKHPNAHR